MTEQLKHKLIGGGAILVVVIVALAFVSWLQQHDDRIQMKATLDAQSQVIAKLNDSIKDRDAQAATDKADIDKKLLEAKTAAQQAALVSQLAGLKQPITIQPLDGHGVQGDSADFPSAPSAAMIPAASIPELAQFAASCKKCEVDRDALVGDNKDLQEKVKATEAKLHAAEVAVNGGTKWTRFKRGAKTLGIGLAVGAALGFAAHK